MVDNICQFVQEVVDFSSQYGSETSISYTASNIAGKCSTYPNYGDFTQTAVLRTYGRWWNDAPSATDGFARTPQHFTSQDFIELRFAEKVYPKSIEVYETYNPGAVVRVLACSTSAVMSHQTVRWVVLWSGKPQRVSAEARVFHPQPLAVCPFPTDLIRLELNHSELDYYTELDAVYLEGSKQPPPEVIALLSNSQCDVAPSCSYKVLPSITPWQHYTLHCDKLSVRDILPTAEILRDFARLHTLDGLSAALDVTDNGHFDLLPEEVIQLIISYLDLTSLCRLSATCRLFYKHCYDPMQYTELNLQPYWHKVYDATLEGLQTRCCRIQRLNLSWCGTFDIISSTAISRYLCMCGSQLTCLRVACCRFVDSSVLTTITTVCTHLQELDIQCCRRIDSSKFISLAKLKKLRSLNLYRTVVDTWSITTIIRSCRCLEHLNLGSCITIGNYDDVAMEISHNCTHLKSLNLWRARGLTDVGLAAIAGRCHGLLELDLGWCSDLQSATGCFVHLVQNCRHLRKLFLTANRTVCDIDLSAIALYCRDIEQLDILGTREVSQQAVLRVLDGCQRLRLFDLSFCSGVDSANIANWKQRFALVEIKRSFQS